MRFSKQIQRNGLFFLLLILTSGIWIYNLGGMLGAWSPIDEGNGDVYLVSNDIIKNFQFETFDGDGISIGGESMDAKLQFESQASWRINPEDIALLNIYTQGDDVYIRYKVAMTSKANIYTTCELTDVAENNQLNIVTEEYLVASYKHRGLFGDVLYSWDSDITWTHYDFGNIKQWNGDHNSFAGDLVMSFDIAQSPLPNFQTVSGDALTKNFDYIAVSSIAVANNLHGLLDDSAPDIVGLTPREYEETKSEKGNLETFGQTEMWVATYQPLIDLTASSTPQNSFDAGIVPQTIGSSMNPRTKSGELIWNPEAEQESMLDCRFIYHVGSLSPLVMEYYGTLSFNSIAYETIDYWHPFPFNIDVKTHFYTTASESYTKPVALHVTNRYIQTQIRVVFDIFTSYNIDVGGDGIEDYNLDFPAEYYDLLLWITTVDGFGGGDQWTSSPWTWESSWIIVIVIVGVVLVGGVIVYFIYLKPMLEAKRTRQLVETAIKSAKRSTRPE